MKLLLKITSLSFCLVMNNHAMSNDQPPLTEEMQSLGLTPFVERNEHIKNIYLIDDKTWSQYLITAREEFKAIEKRKTDEGEKKELIPLYWSLSMQYDYGPANDVLSTAFCLQGFELTENLDWGLFFNSKPSDEYDMNLQRAAYISDRDYYLGTKSPHNADHFHPDDHEHRSHSSGGETVPNDSFSSRESTPPKSAEDPDRQLLLSKEEINTLDSLTEKDWAEIYKQKTIPDHTITKVKNRQPGYEVGSKSYNIVLAAAKKMS